MGLKGILMVVGIAAFFLVGIAFFAWVLYSGFVGTGNEFDDAVEKGYGSLVSAGTLQEVSRTKRSAVWVTRSQGGQEIEIQTQLSQRPRGTLRTRVHWKVQLPSLKSSTYSFSILRSPGGKIEWSRVWKPSEPSAEVRQKLQQVDAAFQDWVRSERSSTLSVSKDGVVWSVLEPVENPTVGPLLNDFRELASKVQKSLKP